MSWRDLALPVSKHTFPSLEQAAAAVCAGRRRVKMGRKPDGLSLFFCFVAARDLPREAWSMCVCLMVSLSFRPVGWLI